MGKQFKNRDMASYMILKVSTTRVFIEIWKLWIPLAQPPHLQPPVVESFRILILYGCEFYGRGICRTLGNQQE